MKKFKNVLAILLVVALFCAFGVSAYADASTHSYEVYKIFSGEQNGSELDSIGWGNGINSDAFLAALKADTAFGEGENNLFYADSNAADVALHVGSFQNDDALLIEFSRVAFANIVTSNYITYTNGMELEAGYYLAVDQTITNGRNDAKNLALLQQTGNGEFEIREKTSVPTLVKKVKDANDSTGAVTDWQDSADYDVGDSIPFQITVQLGTFEAWYQTYAVAIKDTMDNGLTNNNDAVVTINGTDVSDQFSITNTPHGIEISCNDIKAFAHDNDAIVVNYTATLNNSAVIGSRGNDNKANLTFSNNPNNSNEKGVTPNDVVRVFTYKLTVNKIDQDNRPLTGAEFTLSKKNASGTYDVLGTMTVDNTGAVFTWERLDDGDYKISETKTPEGYNTAEDIEFTVSATHDVTSDNPQLTALSGTNNVVADTNLSTGNLSTTVVNIVGVVLPETGGEGTQMLYTLGAILLLGGLVLIVTKKRVGDAA